MNGSEELQEKPADAPARLGQSFLDKLEPIDVLAGIVLVGGLTLVAFHIDGIVGGLLVSVVAYYFGKKGRTPTASA